MITIKIPDIETLVGGVSSLIFARTRKDPGIKKKTTQNKPQHTSQIQQILAGQTWRQTFEFLQLYS